MARAEKMLIIKMLMASTSETPETAASPQTETMTVSAMPMVMDRNCSTISGIISRCRSFLENIKSFLSFMPFRRREWENL